MPPKSKAAEGQPSQPLRKGRRNVNGEGNIRLRQDGRYEGRVYVRAADGMYKRVSRYGDTWESVHEQLTALEIQESPGRDHPDRPHYGRGLPDLLAARGCAHPRPANDLHELRAVSPVIHRAWDW